MITRSGVQGKADVEDQVEIKVAVGRREVTRCVELAPGGRRRERTRWALGAGYWASAKGEMRNYDASLAAAAVPQGEAGPRSHAKNLRQRPAMGSLSGPEALGEGLGRPVAAW